MRGNPLWSENWAGEELLRPERGGGGGGAGKLRMLGPQISILPEASAAGAALWASGSEPGGLGL